MSGEMYEESSEWTESNHYQVVRRMLASGEIKTSDLRNLTIYHELTCAIFTRKVCNCAPVVEVKPWKKEGRNWVNRK